MFKRTRLQDLLTLIDAPSDKGAHSHEQQGQRPLSHWRTFRQISFPCVLHLCCLKLSGRVKGALGSSDITPSELLSQFWENSSRVAEGGVAGEKKRGSVQQSERAGEDREGELQSRGFVPPIR